jgi:pyruvate,water dikinase
LGFEQAAAKLSADQLLMRRVPLVPEQGNMDDTEKSIDRLIYDLGERAKELNCLYEVQELLNTSEITVDEVCQGIVKAIPPGWQYPDVCQAEIIFAGKSYQSPGFQESRWVQSADIIVQDERVGKISVYYTGERPLADEGSFLKEERKLINTIADQFGFFVLHKQLREVFRERVISEEEQKSEWGVILDLLKRTDPGLLNRISRKMINYLSWSGVKDVQRLIEFFSPAFQEGVEISVVNRPFQEQASGDILALSNEVFAIANKYLPPEDILDNIQKWIKEDRSSFLIDTLVNPGSSLAEIGSAIERYHFIAKQGIELTDPREKWFRVALIRRILSDQVQFIEVAKRFIDMDDFYDFMNRVIHSIGSHGKLGGKSSGLFLAAQMLKKTPRPEEFLSEIKTPKTWYLTSDCVFHFMNYNDLEDIVEQKYKDFNQIRQEYPYILHVFKNSPLPPDIVKGLSLALDDFGDVPLIVRSSSLLEDRAKVTFAGKYKSLFIANVGTKEERLVELADAIKEVFSSMFAPDPIEYRHGHRLVDYHEEMGILIQEVVGTKVGHYYFPAFAGVVFNHNEFPWSSRIKREDGLIRIVPGLGTRAVDRLSDDYPILVAPRQPKLRVNVTPEEIIHYSPQKIDVINLKTRTFETVEIRTLLKEFGHIYPNIHQLVSILTPDHIQLPSALGIDFEKDNLVVTFEGLFTRTPFLQHVQTIMEILQEEFNHPVDIEFAHDGTHFYLLQCRAQSYRADAIPAKIPRGIPVENIIFTANRHISNGTISDITHIVYVDPKGYSELSNYQDLSAVGRVVGMLNQILPKHQFILMGPGRWGSRGDIKLGVSVTYSDINNTAMLIEIANQQDDNLPEPSFGTHFFQDLVEASIRYLPLYPDNSKAIFNQEFITTQENMLPKMLPDFAHFADVIRVIDLPASTDGHVLHVYMNANIGEAVAMLGEPSGVTDLERKSSETEPSRLTSDIHWRWRLQMVENIAAQLDPERFGVKAMYILGSTKNATAGPQSDIDIVIHFQGTKEQRRELMTWFEGWSLSLSQINYMRTGYKTDGLLDIHIVTDEDIEKRLGYAARIGAISDPARPLALGTLRKRKNPNRMY